MRMGLKVLIIAALALLAAVFPLLVSTPYFVHVLILMGMYILFALSYDLSVGQVGVLSLAHPAFFGIGAYTGAILAVNYNPNPFLCFFLGALLAGVLAQLLSLTMHLILPQQLKHHAFHLHKTRSENRSCF